MKHATQITTWQATSKKLPHDRNKAAPIGGLSMRTDLRAGLAWDELDDKAQGLWGNLTSALSGLTGGTEGSS